MIKRRGLMLALSSPSGAGKTSIAKALLKQYSQLTMSVSATTRRRRLLSRCLCRMSTIYSQAAWIVQCLIAFL